MANAKLYRPPPIIRGLEMAKKALLEAGHRVIDWKPYKHEEIYTIMRAIWQAGAAEDFAAVAALTGEPVIASMNLDQEIVIPGFDHANIPLSAYQLWQLQKKKRDLREEYLQLWKDTINATGTGRAVDAIISPVAPYTAIDHGKNRSANYTLIWNILDYTALTIPVSKVAPALDPVKPPHVFYNKADKANYELYDPQHFAGAPISIQLVGQRLEEEGVIAMGEILDAALKHTSAKL